MDLVNHLEGRLLFALPKKGRLNAQTIELISGIDLQFRRENRLDIALVKNLPIALVFLPAADIPTFVGEGRVDIGITGRDQVKEHEANTAGEDVRPVIELMDLLFGGCKLQVQVPEKEGSEDPKSLIGKNIVTSFTGLAERYFAELEGVSLSSAEEVPLRKRLRTKIKFVGGSVEAACALGVADGIVDLVESGETMRAAGLKAIDTVVDSTAVLISSSRTSNPQLVDLVASRIRGVINARRYILCIYNIPRTLLPQAKQITPGKRNPTITALDDDAWVAVSVMVERSKSAVAMDELEKLGATDILVLKMENSRTD